VRDLLERGYPYQTINAESAGAAKLDYLSENADMMFARR
jgi:hypothetical protein